MSGAPGEGAMEERPTVELPAWLRETADKLGWNEAERENLRRSADALEALAEAREGLKWALDDFIEAADWYRRCLEDVQDHRVVRGLGEAKAGYDSALDKARTALAASPKGTPPDCPECGVAAGALHRATCFYLTGDPADLRENRSEGTPHE